MIKSISRQARAFSLVEMVTAVGIIGIILFLAIPNIIRVQEDSELNLAIARAEGVNMAIASFVQANGRSLAQSAWAGKSATERYGLIKPYLQYAPTSLAGYLPGYSIAFPGTLGNLTKVVLSDASGAVIPY